MRKLLRVSMMDKRHKKNIEKWGKANPWFASSDGKCELSQLAISIEKDLVSKGHKYGTKKLLDLLDRKLSAHVSAHIIETDHLREAKKVLAKGFNYRL